MEPRNRHVAGAETVEIVERNMSNAVMRGIAVLPGSKSMSRAKGMHRKLGDPAFGQRQHYALARIGKAPVFSRDSQILKFLIRSSAAPIRGRQHRMGQALAIKQMDHTAWELRAIAGKSSDGPQIRRLLAIALVLDGDPRTQAAEQTGMDRQTLRDWVHRYNDGGTDGLKSRSSPGREPFLTDAQKAELKALVIEGPAPERHNVVRWRLADLQAEIGRRFSVHVHLSTVGKWLHQLNLTRLQPRPIHPKKDPAAEEAFKKNTLVLG